MSRRALKEGKPAGTEGWTSLGKSCDAPQETITCDCGWHGKVEELLVIDGDIQFFCPDCGSPGWIFD